MAMEEKGSERSRQTVALVSAGIVILQDIVLTLKWYADCKG